jgi:hypothetical protein
MNFVTIPALALTGVVLFRYKNPQPYLLNWTSGFVLAIFFTIFLIGATGYYVGVLWIVPASGLLITYLLRFRAKVEKGSVDYFKWLGIVLLSIWPLCFYYFESPDLNDIFYALSYLTVPVLGVT